MKDKTLLILPKIFLVILSLNILIIDIFLLKETKKPLSQPVSTPQSQPTLPLPSPETTSCSSLCQKEIGEIVSNFLATISAMKKTEQKSENKPLITPKAQATIYIPLVTSASTTSMDWIDIIPSDFYFDLADYPNAKSVHFDVYLKALHGSGRVYTRLYDVTNKRAVDYSDHSTQSADFELMRSSPLVIWRGNNLYRVQMKSINGTEAFLEQAKLRIVLN